VAALVASAFRFYAGPGDELRVRAIAPTYASEGWDASVSVIETVMADRPFIVDTLEAALEARASPCGAAPPIVGRAGSHGAVDLACAAERQRAARVVRARRWSRAPPTPRRSPGSSSSRATGSATCGW